MRATKSRFEVLNRSFKGIWNLIFSKKGSIWFKTSILALVWNGPLWNTSDQVSTRPKEFQVSIRSYSEAEFLHFFTKIPSHSSDKLPHSSASNTPCRHCSILVTMNNGSKSSNALLSTHSSSTSSENDTLQAAQDDSKVEDAINDDDLQDENVTKLSEYHAKNYFNSTMGGEGCSGSFRHGNWMQYKKPSQR